MKNAIEIKNLNVKYANFALKDVAFTVPEGMIVGFVGENGAGKTTTLKSLMNIVKIERGDMKIFGKDYHKDEMAIKADCGVVLDDAFFHDKLTPQQIESVLKSVYKDWDSAYFHQGLATGKISPSRKLKECSKGMIARLKILCACAHHPKLLILDEPTSGLDPVARDDMLELFQEFVEAEDHSILFSSHITSDIEKIADYVVFIHDGEIVFEIEKDHLLEVYGIVKCSQEDAAELGDFPYLYHRRTAYADEFLIDNRQAFKKEYPDLIVDPAAIDETLVIMKKGQKKKVPVF